MHLTAVYYNKGERQKGTHQRTSLSTAAFTVISNLVFEMLEPSLTSRCYRTLNAPTAKFYMSLQEVDLNFLTFAVTKTEFYVHILFGHGVSGV